MTHTNPPRCSTCNAAATWFKIVDGTILHLCTPHRWSLNVLDCRQLPTGNGNFHDEVARMCDLMAQQANA